MTTKSFSEIPDTAVCENPHVERAVQFFVENIGNRIINPKRRDRVHVELEITNVLRSRKPELIRPVLQHDKIRTLVHVARFLQ